MMHSITPKANGVKISADKKISFALMWPFVILAIQYFVLIFFNLLGSGTASKVQLISKLLVGLVYLVTLPAVLERGRLRFILVYLVSALLFLLHYLFFPENREYLAELIFPFFFLCLPALIYSMSIQDLPQLKEIMKRAGSLVFLVGAVLGILILTGTSSIGTYSMSLSYYMLLPAILFCDDLMEKYSLKSLLLFLASIGVILAFGSRGALLCLLVFIFLKIIRPEKHYTMKRVIGNLLVIAAGLLIYLNLNQLLLSFYAFLLTFGIKSRSLWIFIHDSSRLSGRDILYENIIRQISEHPIFGIGLAGDRRILDGSYVHNLVLEVLSNFGIALGLISLLLLLALIIKSLLGKNIMKYNMVIIWLSLGFVHLMVSTSYLIDMKFWIFLGLLLNMTGKYQWEKEVIDHEEKDQSAVPCSQV